MWQNFYIIFIEFIEGERANSLVMGFKNNLVLTMCSKHVGISLFSVRFSSLKLLVIHRSIVVFFKTN